MFSKSSTKPQSNKYDRIHVLKSEATSLHDLITDPPEGAIRMKITPELAAEMLTYNTDNRLVRPRTVGFYAHQMAQEKWAVTGETIIFSWAGVLLDGQHRLLACVESGAEFEAFVAFGLDPKVRDHIDTGMKRSPGDVFTFHGVKAGHQVAAITKWVRLYDIGAKSDGSTGLAVISNADLFEYYLEHPEIELGRSIAFKFSKNRLATPANMGALYVVCTRKNKAQADEFFDKIATGLGLSARYDPAGIIRNRLIGAATDDV